MTATGRSSTGGDSNPEHAALRSAVRTLLQRRSGSAAVRAAMNSPTGYDEQLWQLLCEQIGVAALAIPERFGGAGASVLETHVVLDELGRTLTPCPMLGCAVFAAQALLALDDEDAAARLLPAIAAGTTLAAVCWAGPDGGWDPRRPAASLRGDAVHGTTSFVLDGDLADVLLVVTRDGDHTALVEVDPTQPGVRRQHTPSMDPTRRLATVEFDGATVRRIGLGDASDALANALDITCVGQSAEQVGAATRILEMTVDYAKVRVQFGRPIGSFQALKHRMADMYVRVEAARSASYAAAAGTVSPSVAKVACSEALFDVAAEAIQLHGGIAITWEHDAHLYFKRAHGSAQLFGSPAEYLSRMAAAAGIEDR